MTTGVAYILLFTALAFGVLSQLIIKWQISKVPSVPSGWGERAVFIVEILIQPWMIIAIISTFLAGVCWMMTLYKLPLNVAYPYLALIFPIMILASYLVFDEPLNTFKIIGISLIFVGLVIANRAV